MPRKINVSNPLVFEGLFSIWKQHNYDLYFYFDEIFDKALEALKSRVDAGPIQLKAGDEPIYKAMFLPVGLRIENIALISLLFSPLHLTIAFSETTKASHRRYFHIVEERIQQYSTSTTIDKIPPISSNDHQNIEKKILDWAERIKTGYGFAADEMAIDLTGGTKPMSIGAQNAAISLGIPAFYLSVDYDLDTKLPLPGTECLLEMPRSQSQTDKNTVFVIMPFSQEFDSVFLGIKESVAESGLRCTRVDQEIFSGGIMDRVRKNIATAGTIIADLSMHNPNVYYELGLGHAWNKNVIMITQDVGRIPFDLKHLRMVVYDREDMDSLRKKLKDELAALKDA